MTNARMTNCRAAILAAFEDEGGEDRRPTKRYAVIFSSFIILVLSLLFLCTLAETFAASDADDSKSLTLAEIQEFRAKGIPDDQWPALLEALGSNDQSAAVRALIHDQPSFPRE